MDTLTIRRRSSAEPTMFSKFEEDALLQLKQHIEDYLCSNNLQHQCPNMARYLENAKRDDKLLLHYLQARKDRVNDAWNTLQMYVENRFLYYPHIFADHLSDKVETLLKRHIIGVLKNLDKFGRRIVFLDTTKWDIKEYSVDDLITAIVIGVERFCREPEVLGHGLIVVENSRGFGSSHAKQLTPRQLLKIRNAYQSFPISVQGLYYLGVPYVLGLIFKMGKNLTPRKLRSRMFFYSDTQTPNELYDIASPEILPDWMGGSLSIEEAAEDYSFLASYLG